MRTRCHPITSRHVYLPAPTAWQIARGNFSIVTSVLAVKRRSETGRMDGNVLSDTLRVASLSTLVFQMPILPSHVAALHQAIEAGLFPLQ